MDIRYVCGRNALTSSINNNCQIRLLLLEKISDFYLFDACSVIFAIKSFLFKVKLSRWVRPNFLCLLIRTCFDDLRRI